MLLFLSKDQNRLEICWDEEILSIEHTWRRKKKSSRSAVVMRARVIKSASKKADNNLIMAVSFMLPTDLVVDKCVILCIGFDLSTIPVVLSLRGNKLLVLAKQMIFSVIGQVRMEDNCLISMLVLHPTSGEMSMSIRFCSHGEKHIAEVTKMLGGRDFSGFYGFYES